MLISKRPLNNLLYLNGGLRMEENEVMLENEEIIEDVMDQEETVSAEAAEE